MELLLALLLQSAAAPEPAPRLSYAAEAAEPAEPRARVNQGRSARIDWGSLSQSLAAEPRSEQRQEAPAPRAAPQRRAPGRVTIWNGAPIRMVNGQPHGVW